MATPLHSRAAVGLRPARSITRRTLGELTAHWAGPSPWSGADRSTAARFYSTTNHARCASIWRAWQSFHMDDPSRRWADIAYTSGVCPHGHRYEGRGVDVRTAANGTTAGNNGSHATCYIAGQGDPLTSQAKAAYADESRRLRGLRKGHRDWKPTECPGDVLYRWVHGGQPVAPTVPGPRPTPPPIEEEDDDMPATKRLVHAKKVAYVLPDGTICDQDIDGKQMLDGSRGDDAMRAVYLSPVANEVQVDRAKIVVRLGAAARANNGGDALLRRLSDQLRAVELRLEAVQNAVVTPR